MFKVSRLLFLVAESPLHPGSGSEIGVVDLPIQRERHTGYPKIEGSSLKGCIRESFDSRKNDGDYRTKISLLFGPEESAEHAGAMIITDARLLFFPVKSLKGVFAWVTCPMVLERFKRDILAFAISFPFPNEISSFSSLVGTVPEKSELFVSSKVILEEFAFEVREHAGTSKMANLFANAVFGDSSYAFWKEKLSRSLVVLPDGDFCEFVKTSTEIVTRTKIDSVKGTVQKGGLWTEEYLPQDTVMYAVAAFTRARVADGAQEAGGVKAQEMGAEKMAQFFSDNLPRFIQVGGNQTVGKGFVRLVLYKEGEIRGDEREKA